VFWGLKCGISGVSVPCQFGVLLLLDEVVYKCKLQTVDLWYSEYILSDFMLAGSFDQCNQWRATAPDCRIQCCCESFLTQVSMTSEQGSPHSDTFLTGMHLAVINGDRFCTDFAHLKSTMGNDLLMTQFNHFILDFYRIRHTWI